MGVGSSKNWRVAEAHCVSWELHFGPIPEGLHVCHSCDNPPCVNPAHLFLGTNNDNRQDSVRKGRHAKGEETGHATLTDSDVLQIRQEYAKGNVSQATLSAKYGVSQAIISKAVRGENWKHVDGPRSIQRHLTAEQVAEIRAAYAVGNVSQQQLGARYDVNQSMISAVIRCVGRYRRI